jgi:phosphoribosylanthranilate isomerase
MDNHRIRVKVCCIASVEEAHLALRYGASAIGLVSAMPSGPGPISEQHIAEIVARVPADTDTFLLTSLTDLNAITEQHQRCGTRTIQFVDSMERGANGKEHGERGAEQGAWGRLRKALPGVLFVQVIHVTDASSIEEALAYVPYVDALLLDSGRPNAVVKELGGTGRVHDWSLSREIVTRASCPVWLAGGLNASNVGEAIRTVRPYGVDLCSGVRTDGRLDEEKLRRFMGAVKA